MTYQFVEPDWSPRDYNPSSDWGNMERQEDPYPNPPRKLLSKAFRTEPSKKVLSASSPTSGRLLEGFRGSGPLVFALFRLNNFGCGLNAGISKAASFPLEGYPEGGSGGLLF